MADIKISELLPAVTPLSGTETLPIVQNGNTVKATTQSISSLFSLGYTAENVANKSTDSSFAGATDLNYPSQLAVKTYVDNSLGNSGWGLLGNSGTTSANFIGTTDAQDFILKSSNFEGLRLKTDGSVDAQLRYRIRSSNLNYVQLDKISNTGRLVLMNQNVSSQVDLRCANITTSRTLQLPDKDGTLATEDYLVYTALITYAGAGVVNATVLKNTLGVSFNWTNPSNGIARITAASGTPFTTSKTWISSGAANIGGTPYFVTGDLAAGNIIVNFRFYLHDGTISSTPSFTNYSVEIRVYP